MKGNNNTQGKKAESFSKDELQFIWLALYTQRKYYDFTNTGTPRTKAKATRLFKKTERMMYRGD